MGAPDLPPEDWVFFITEAGTADSEKVSSKAPAETEAAPSDGYLKGTIKKGGKKITTKKFAPEPEVLITPAVKDQG